MPAAAQVTKYEGRTIANIEFFPKQQPLTPAQLHEILSPVLRIREPFRAADVRTAIERLFATGRYEDIQVDAEMVGEQVNLRFITQNNWFVGHVAVEGGISDPPNRGQLANATRLELGRAFTKEKMEEAQQGMRQLLESNGLYRHRIQPLFEYDPHGQQIHLNFLVEAGKRARFAPPILKGEFKAEREDVLSATKWRRWILGSWKPVTQARTRRGVEGVRQMYQKQGRLEAKVSLDAVDYIAEENRVRPTLSIEAGPRIDVRTVGEKLSRRVLRRQVPIYEENTVDRDLLVEGARNLENYFQARGYFDAEVEFKPSRVINDKATIDFLINKGRRHKLRHIDIRGNRYFPVEELRDRMFLQEASFLQFRHGRYSEDLLERDRETIANLYQSNGFQDVKVRSRVEENYQGEPDALAVFIEVEEGPQWLVGELEVEGIQTLDKNELMSTLSSMPGQPYSEFNIALDRDAILQQYFGRGFSNAVFEWSFTPVPAAHRVNLRYVITEGQRMFVRQVLVNGLRTTDPDLINRNLFINPNDPLSLTQMTDTQRRFYDLGIFARVDTAIQNPDGATERKYVIYDIEEARKYSLAVGFGAEIARIGGGSETSIQGAAGQAGFAPRVSLDLTRLNVWGEGHAISFRSRFSTLQRRGLLNYSWPRYRNIEGLNASWTALYDDSRDVRTFSARRREVSAQLSQRVSKATTFFYRYSFRRVSVDTASLKIAPLLVPQLSQPVRLGLLAGNVLQDRRDDPTDPRKGIYNTLDLSLAQRWLGSQRNFWRVLLRNATYHPISRRLVLARSTSFGHIDPFRFTRDPIEAIPLPERFFAGGGSSHRGFPENQAGPRDLVTGFPLGGTAQLFNQTELRFPLLGDNIGGVLFHDAGNVYSSLSKISFRFTQRDVEDFDYMAHAVGFGLRYRTPVGPLRVDLAYSINAPRFVGFKGTREELLNAGVDPCAVPVGGQARCVEQRVSRLQFFFSIGQTF